MMKAPCISLLLAIFLFCVPAPAYLMQTHGPDRVNASLQSVDTAWVRFHGPVLIPGDDDEGYAIASDPYGNLYVTGISWHSGTEYDFATMKYNAAGMMQWVARYNGPANNDDWAYDVAVDCSGNVYVTGVSKGAQTGFASYATIKYDNAGLEQWVATYAGPLGFSSPSSLAVDPQGNVYVTGRSNSWSSEKGGSQSDLATIKYNPSGVELWVARYVGPGHQSGDAKAVAVDSSGNVYVVGYTTGSGTSTDYTTIKYNAFGEEQWVARYNGPGNERDLARTLAVDFSGNVYVGGQSTGDGGYDYAVVKYDASGAEQWVARYDGPGNGPDVLEALAVDDSGNSYATGEAGGLDGFDICATIKYSSSGVEQWVSLHSGPKNTHARGWGIVLDRSGHAYVMGTSNSGYTTIAYDVSGSEQWCHSTMDRGISTMSPWALP
jgi:hypothetical protein